MRKITAMLGVVLFASAAAEAITFDGRISTAEWGAYYLESPHVEGDFACPWFDWDVYGYYDDDYVVMGVKVAETSHPLSAMWAIGQMYPGGMGFYTPSGHYVYCSLGWLPPLGWAPGGLWDYNWWVGVWIPQSLGDAPAGYHPLWDMGWDGAPGVAEGYYSLEWFGGEYGYYTGYLVSGSTRAHGGPLPGDCTAPPEYIALNGQPPYPVGYGNADGRVDSFDRDVVLQNLGLSGLALDGSFRLGDFDQDGAVTPADLAILDAWEGERMAFEIKVPWAMIEAALGPQTLGAPLDWQIEFMKSWMYPHGEGGTGMPYWYPNGVNSSSATGIQYIPEPATVALMGLGVVQALLLRKKR